MAQGYDWLTIYEANSKKIGEYAMGDNEQPPTDWKKTETNVLILHVQTDYATRKKGFVMHWEFVVEDCGCNQNGTRQDGCDKDTRACTGTTDEPSTSTTEFTTESISRMTNELSTESSTQTSTDPLIEASIITPSASKFFKNLK